MKKKNVILTITISIFIISLLSSFASAATCGNGRCEFGETPSSCPRDCGSVNFCGDGSCNNGETCNTCKADCGTCPPLPPQCTPHAYTACYGSGDNTDRYFFNSCGQREELAQDCGNSASGANFCSNNDVYNTYTHRGCQNNLCYQTNENIIQQDCGVSGYSGANFCSNNDVYKTYITRGCQNSACYSTQSNIIQQDCGEDSTSTNFCSNNDVYNTVTDRGCSAGTCYANNQNQLVQDCGESAYTGNNYCENDDVYTTYEAKGCQNNACYANTQSQLVQDCGEDTFSSDSDGGFFIFTYGQCSAGTDNGCADGNCFSNIGTNPGSDSCIDTSSLYEFQTSGDFNCILSLVNCDDQDIATADETANTCSWTDYNCGAGQCTVKDSESADCDDYDNQNNDYYVTATSCSIGCTGIQCCESQPIIICTDNDEDTFFAISPQCPQGDDCDDNNANIHPDAAETCNNIDDNCDGQIDEDIIRQCGISDVGICAFGQETCNFGNFEGCDATLPTDEICFNQLDDNCDGQTDENCAQCGNDIIETGEECDNGAQNGEICLPSYGQTCNWCTLSCTNESETGPFCGDNVLQPSDEECEGTDLNLETCNSQGFFSGTLSCTENCEFNTSGCSSCFEDWQQQTNACQNDDTRLISYIDTNSCGTTINLPSDNGTYTTCDYCIPNPANTAWSDFTFNTCQDPQTNQTRNLTTYDANNCFAQTGLVNDLFNNITIIDSRLVGPDYVNDTSASQWINITDCRPDSTMLWERTIRQYDAFGCANDIFITEQNTTSCNYCAEDWQQQTNACQNDDTRLISYIDTNSCGTTINLPSDNGTYTTCDSCTPEWTLNQTWSLCIDNTQSRTYYDNKNCFAQTGLPSDLTGQPSDETQSCTDIELPIITIINPENQNYNYTQIPIEIICTDNTIVNSIQYMIASTSYPYIGPTIFNAEENQTYTLQASCTDIYNNVATASVIFSTNMSAGNGTDAQDLTNPSLIIYSPLNQNYNYTNIPVSMSCTDNIGVDEIWYELDGTRYNYVSGNLPGIVENSTYTLVGFCNDTSNNVATMTRIFSTNVSAANMTPTQDLDVPEVQIIRPENQNYNYTQIPIEIICADAFQDSIWYNINNGADQVYYGPITFNAEENMTYRINAYCNDSANHIGTDFVVFSTNTTAANQTPAQDLDAPVLEIIQPINNTNYNTTNVPLNISCTDIFGVDSVWFFVNSQARQEYTDSLQFVPDLSENHRFRLSAFCNDSANHVASEGITFDIFPDSNVTNTTLDDNTTIDNSTVIDSNITNSTINNTEIIGVGCTIINSTLNNVKLNLTGYCYIKNEYHENETVIGYGYHSSNGDPVNNTITAWIFESTNSTYNFNIIYGDNNTYFTRSEVNDSIIGNTNITDSVVLFADLYNCTVIESSVSHIYGRNCVIRNSNVNDNSTITDSNITNSNITNSIVTNSTIADSVVTNSTIDNSNITNSTLIDFIVNDANITDYIICNGTISQEGFTYDASLEGCADIRTLFDYAKNATIQSPTQGASYIIGTNIIFSADITLINRWNATKNYTSAWEFGDGTNANTTNTSHTYSGNSRPITATLTIDDGRKTTSFNTTFSLTANCSDAVQNQDETSPDTGGVCSPPRSGGGGGSATPYKINFIDFSNSCTQDIRMNNGDKIRITLQGTEYQYTQTQTTNQAVLYGEGQELTINLDSKKGYDLNKDGINDVYITLTGINSGLASYTLGIIDCRLTGTLNITNTTPITANQTSTGAPANQTTTITSTPINNQTTNMTGANSLTGYLIGPIGFLKSNWLWILIVLLLILLILAALYFLFFKKKEKKEKKTKKSRKK